MRYVTAASLALAFALVSMSASAGCPGHVETVSTPSPVVTADQAGPTTRIVVPSGG
jgi:hypothetical protein